MTPHAPFRVGFDRIEQTAHSTQVLRVDLAADGLPLAELTIQSPHLVDDVRLDAPVAFPSARKMLFHWGE